MCVATKLVEFSFNHVMYKQTNGVAMGSPLGLIGPALANSFGGYNENKLFTSVEKPLLYTRYVDDTFAIFRSEAKATEAQKCRTQTSVAMNGNIFNSMHKSLY